MRKKHNKPKSKTPRFIRKEKIGSVVRRDGAFYSWPKGAEPCRRGAQFESLLLAMQHTEKYWRQKYDR